MKCRGKIVRNDCFMEYPVAFFIVFREVAHAVLIQTLKVKSLFILTYIFKMLFEPLFWGAANTLEERPTVHFLPCGLCVITLILANLSRKVQGGTGWSSPSCSISILHSPVLPKHISPRRYAGYLPALKSKEGLLSASHSVPGRWGGKKSITYLTRD